MQVLFFFVCIFICTFFSFIEWAYEMSPPLKKRKRLVNARQRRVRFRRYLFALSPRATVSHQAVGAEESGDQDSISDTEFGFFADNESSSDETVENDTTTALPICEPSNQDSIEPGEDNAQSGYSLPPSLPDSDVSDSDVSNSDDETLQADAASECGEDEDFDEAQLAALLVDDSDVDGPTELRQFLANYVASNSNISGAAASQLLAGLKSLKKQNGHFDGLPRDVRALLKTPRRVSVMEAAGGTYYHFGLANGILSRLSVPPSFSSLAHFSPVEILVSMDGLPLFKSSRTEFWVIQGVLRGEVTPFPIGVWSGIGKPTCCNTYLRAFVDEAKHLQEEGLLHHSRHHEVKIWGCPCDAPARSMVTGTKGHTAENACPRCKTVGVYYRKPGHAGGRETFPDLEAELRTHQEYVAQTRPADHYNVRSILQELDLDMVLDFPFDYM